MCLGGDLGVNGEALFVSSDVVLEDVTYGGTINTACHGTGKTQARERNNLAPRVRIMAILSQL